MIDNPIDKFSKKQGAKDFAAVLFLIFDAKPNDALIRGLLWFTSIVMQVLSAGAKILTRKKLGVRAGAGFDFILHAIPIIIIAIVSLRGTKFLLKTDYQTSVYLLVYGGIIFILGIFNYLNSKTLKGFELYTPFRGYGLFALPKKHHENTLRWVRLSDPLILAFIAWTLHSFLGNSFQPLAILLYASSVILFVEELLYIKNDYNFDLNIKDGPILSDQKSKEAENTDIGY